MSTSPSWERVRLLSLIILFLMSWGVMTWIIAHYPTPERMPVAAMIPTGFPVLVISPAGSSYHAEIIPNSRLDDYISGLDSYTFLVPEGKADDLNKQVATGLRYEDCFEVRELAKGKQSLKVVWHWRGDTIEEIGWYVAGSTSFVPKYYQSGKVPLFRATLGAPLILMAEVLLWLAGVLVYRRLKRRQGD